MPSSALSCSLAAGVVAALAVAEQRVGLALSAGLLLILAAAALARGTAAIRPLPAVLAVGLALQPLVRDAAWVVAVTVGAALVAGAAAVAPADAWTHVARIVTAPLRLVAGNVVIARATHGRLARPARGWPGAAIARGVLAAAVLLGAFGGLFALADPAFAEVADDVFTYDGDPGPVAWRAVIALLFTGAAGALVRVAIGQTAAAPMLRWTPGCTELVIVLSTLTALFAAFVGVRLRVLFGGADYVLATTGLGYGEYARQGFGALLVVCGLTLALVGLSARRQERVVRALLAALCGLTLVVLASAHQRLGLVEDAYGFTRARFAGHAVVLWLAALFTVVLVAGAHRRAAAVAPRLVLSGTLVALLALSLANPDGRIASSAVGRFEQTGQLDRRALSRLSADALPAVERLPPRERTGVSNRIRSDRLARADGLAGFNVARARAR